jgi:signal peptidase II
MSDAPENPPDAAETPAQPGPSVVAVTPAKPKPPPTFVFFGLVAGLSLLADIAAKAWAEIVLSQRTMVEPAIVLVPNHLSLTLAYNKGGAWGLLQNASEVVRRPFFLAVSILAILFIVSLYGKLVATQRSLKWGLPLVLGGALGNLSDRITRSSVIDFIDYRADWVDTMNRMISKGVAGWGLTDHWPTFNVADISICVGVALMGVDMLTSRRGGLRRAQPAPALAAASSPGSVPPATG